MSKPLGIDLFCGLGGFTEGLLAAGYYVVGFDLERHRYPARAMPSSDARKVARDGVDFNSKSADSRDRSFNYANQCAVRDAPPTGEWDEYPAQLVLQDVLTLHGSQFKDAALIVASPPCQEYSYMAMPWSRAKAIAAEYRSGVRDVKKLTALFDACFRIQREAIEAAGHHIPLVVENVRGAIPWVGRSRWNYGSFHLWGDVPALMPMTAKMHFKIDSPHLHLGDPRCAANSPARVRYDERKNPGFRFDGSGRSMQSESVDRHVKNGGDWFDSEQPSLQRRQGSGTSARKAASALIAKIPLPLALHIAKSWLPQDVAA